MLGDPALFLFFPPFSFRSGRHSSFDTRSSWRERPSQQFGKSAERICAIEFLTSRALRRDLKDTFFVDAISQALDDSSLLLFR